MWQLINAMRLSATSTLKLMNYQLKRRECLPLIVLFRIHTFPVCRVPLAFGTSNRRTKKTTVEASERRDAKRASAVQRRDNRNYWLTHHQSSQRQQQQQQQQWTADVKQYQKTINCRRIALPSRILRWPTNMVPIRMVQRHRD